MPVKVPHRAKECPYDTNDISKTFDIDQLRRSRTRVAFFYDAFASCRMGSSSRSRDPNAKSIVICNLCLQSLYIVHLSTQISYPILFQTGFYTNRLALRERTKRKTEDKGRIKDNSILCRLRDVKPFILLNGIQVFEKFNFFGPINFGLVYEFVPQV